MFAQPAKLTFIAADEGFLVFKDGDVGSGVKIRSPFLTVAIETVSGKSVAVANLTLSRNISLVILDVKALSFSRDSAVAYVEYYSREDLEPSTV